MQIQNSFQVPLPLERAWEILLDIPRIVPCMPGAQLLEVEGDGVYTGEVAVRLGPVMLRFRGRAEITERDDAAHSAKVRAQARDTKGRGGASADVAFNLVALDGANTRVDLVTDLTLSGSIAQYGRGSGMIEDLANHMIGEFSANLERELQSEGAIPTAVQPSEAITPAESAEPAPAAAAQPAPAQSPAGHGAGAARSSAPRPAAPISGFSLGLKLFWRALGRGIRGLFGRR